MNGVDEEDLDEAGQLVERVHPATQGDHVGVVVLPGERCGLLGPHQGRPDAGDLVGGHLLAVARAADHDAEAVAAGGPLPGDGVGRPQAEDRVVVEGVVLEGAVVDRLVAVLAQPAEEVVLEVEAGVVAAQVHSHAGILSVSLPWSPGHQGVEADRDGRGDPEVDPLVGHVDGVLVPDAGLALDREERRAVGADEVEVDRQERDVR